jgi:two-component system LytT family response regulator
MKAIIVEDEYPAMKLLKEYLQLYTQFEIIAECIDGFDAIKCINLLKPDVVFLDIQIPGKTGFEVLQEIDHIPKIIFTTAYDSFAIKAFDVSAIDYVLKPYTKERLNTAIEKLEDKNNNVLMAMQLLSDSLISSSYPKRILVEDGNKLVNIPTDSILYIEASGDYSIINTLTQTFLSNRGLIELEKKLDPELFQRVHRSNIIALSAIKEVLKSLTGLKLVLVNGTEIKVSRSYAEAIRKLIY